MKVTKKVINKTLLTCLMLSIFSVSLLEAKPSPSEINRDSQNTSLRSFYELFPDLTANQARRAFSDYGLRNTYYHYEKPKFVPALNSGIDLINSVNTKKPTQLVEALIVVPYNGKTLSLLDAYNAIGRIENIKDYQVYSSAQDRYISIFTESTRLNNNRRNSVIPDPPPATRLPSADTFYLCIRDAWFGNTYFRGDFSTAPYGINYKLTNYLAVWYLVFPVMGAEKFATNLYIEPLEEGMLVYGMVGIDIPEIFVAKMNMSSNINRRLTVFINWLSDGFSLVS